MYIIQEQLENGFATDYWNVIDPCGDVIAACPNKPCAEKICKAMNLLPQMKNALEHARECLAQNCCSSDYNNQSRAHVYTALEAFNA